MNCDAAETALLLVTICAIISIGFFHLQAKRSRLEGIAYGYRMSQVEWCEVIETKGGLEEDLMVALHDAINRPKGVVPKSADKFYDAGRYDHG